MSHTVTLPSGNTAVFRDPDDLTLGDREDLIDQLAPDGQLAAGGLNRYNRAMMALVIESWTLTDRASGEPLPVPAADPTVVRRLPLNDGAFLQKQIDPYVKTMFPSFDVEPEGSPTGPSPA
jgi:hypothetical protein